MSKLLIVTGSTSSGKTTHARDWAWRHEAIVRDEFTSIGVVVDLLRRGHNVAVTINLPADTDVRLIHVPPRKLESYEVVE